MRKNKNLRWYAFREEFNTNRLEYINVLGEEFAKEVLRRVKKDKIQDMYDFKDLVESMLMYRYWAKAEHEVVVRSLHHRPDRDNEFKIDVWYQLEPNLDRICEYIMKELQLEFEE